MIKLFVFIYDYNLFGGGCQYGGKNFYLNSMPSIVYGQDRASLWAPYLLDYRAG